MKNLIKNSLFALLVITGISSTSGVHAGYFKQLASLAARVKSNIQNIFNINVVQLADKQLLTAGKYKGPSYASYATHNETAQRIFNRAPSLYESHMGNVIKGLAKQYYGLNCQYPVYVEKGLRRKKYAIALASAGAICNPDGTRKAANQQIRFDYDYVKELNIKSIIATLFHENEHLKMDHILSQQKLRILKDDALTHNVPIVLDGKTFSQEEFDLYTLKVSRLQEEEADAAIRYHHADLCYALNNQFGNAEHLLDDVTTLLMKKNTFPIDIDLNTLYTKAINGDLDAREVLEKDLTHPLNGVRAVYLLKWAQEAEAKQTTKTSEL